jgi:hypothetical protein
VSCTDLSSFTVISPALFQAYPDVLDEWALAEAMCADGKRVEKDYDELIVSGFRFSTCFACFFERGLGGS